MPENQTVSLTSTICPSSDPLAAEIDNEVVLMSIEQGSYYSLDTIGTDIWKRLDGQITVSDLCSALIEEYEADPDTIRRDVLALLQQLAAEGLIEIQP